MENSLYSLQGNFKKIDENINNMENNFYKNYFLGYSYLIGKNEIENIEKAEYYLKEASKYCFSPAHYSLGYLNLKTNKVDEAKKWFFSARDLGDNLAAHQLALIYKKESNSKKMLENLNFSEGNGFVPSITELGVQYYDGVLVAKNLKKAFKYFEKAALKNDALAQNNLAWMYENGEGTIKDIEKAKYWYKISLNNGFSLAAKNLNRLNGESASSF